MKTFIILYNYKITLKVKAIIFLYIFFNSFKFLFINQYKFPKVSIFLPIYNKENFLKRSINSIQKQSLKELEIIAINDCSTDNSLKILRKLYKEDKRIKIFSNDRNHGLLYTRAMGILNSTGEYMINLDPDDVLSSKYDLKILYKIANNFNADVILFKIKKIKNKKFFNINKKININKLCINNYSSKIWKKLNLITNKFIKKNIYIKAFKYFKNKIFGYKWNYGEDNVWSLLIKKYAKSYIYINKYFYLYIMNKKSLMFNLGNYLEKKNRIYRLLMYQNIIKKSYYKYIKILFNNLKNEINNDIEIRNKFINLILYDIKLK